MFDIVRKEIEWGGETLSMETGKVARQADGSVIVTYGETTVMANVVFDKKPKVGLDFFPLTVNYNEKYYAAGKIPGGFFKREGPARPRYRETLTSAPHRPPAASAFRADGFMHEVQIDRSTVLSRGRRGERSRTSVGIIGGLRGAAPSRVHRFRGPAIGGARCDGWADTEDVLDPLVDQTPKLRRERRTSDIDILVAGSKGRRSMMVEGGALRGVRRPR